MKAQAVTGQNGGKLFLGMDLCSLSTDSHIYSNTPEKINVKTTDWSKTTVQSLINHYKNDVAKLANAIVYDYSHKVNTKCEYFNEKTDKQRPTRTHYVKIDDVIYFSKNGKIGKIIDKK